MKNSLDIALKIIGKEPTTARQILVDNDIPLSLACQITAEYYNQGVIAGDPGVIARAICKLMSIDVNEAKEREEMIFCIEGKTDGFEDTPWSLIPTRAIKTIYRYVVTGSAKQ